MKITCNLIYSCLFIILSSLIPYISATWTYQRSLVLPHGPGTSDNPIFVGQNEHRGQLIFLYPNFTFALYCSVSYETITSLKPLPYVVQPYINSNINLSSSDENPTSVKHLFDSIQNQTLTLTRTVSTISFSNDLAYLDLGYWDGINYGHFRQLLIYTADFSKLIFTYPLIKDCIWVTPSSTYNKELDLYFWHTCYEIISMKFQNGGFILRKVAAPSDKGIRGFTVDSNSGLMYAISDASTELFIVDALNLMTLLTYPFENHYFFRIFLTKRHQLILMANEPSRIFLLNATGYPNFENYQNVSIYLETPFFDDKFYETAKCGNRLCINSFSVTSADMKTVELVQPFVFLDYFFDKSHSLVNVKVTDFYYVQYKIS